MRGLQEIVPIQDTVISGLGGIERLSGNMYRFWFYIEQTDDDGGIEKIVVTKLVTPASAVPDAVLRTIAAMVDPASKALTALVPADLVN